MPARRRLSRYTVVHVKQDGKWLMASVREASIELPSNFARVEGLGWLVGTWKAERDGTAMHTTIRWIANKSFLEREYTIRKDGIAVSSGKQIIGWDPEGQADPLVVVRRLRRTWHGTLDGHARWLADRVVRRAARRHADRVARSADSRPGRRQRARLAIGRAERGRGLVARYARGRARSHFGEEIDLNRPMDSGLVRRIVPFRPMTSR